MPQFHSLYKTYLRFPGPQVSYQICRHHHEKFDGRGYPDGLVGDEIPIAAQIVSIADVYDALVNERVYKDAFPKEEAFRMITEGECGKFNPMPQFHSLYKTYLRFPGPQASVRDQNFSGYAVV